MLARFDTARYVDSIADIAGLGSSRLASTPEVAFAGRSNAGKSSAINALANRTRLAYASKLPGRTQMLNFFALEQAAGGAVAGHLVDLPGYGFARVDAATRRRWNDLIASYLGGRAQLRGVVLVIDSRRGLMASGLAAGAITALPAFAVVLERLFPRQGPVHMPGLAHD